MKKFPDPQHCLAYCRFWAIFFLFTMDFPRASVNTVAGLKKNKNMRNLKNENTT
jgi:hypothetical protein